MSSDDKSPAIPQCVYPLPKFNMDELYEPTRGKIKVNDLEHHGDGEKYDERTFTVQCEFICRHSEYFRGVFEGNFTETTDKMSTITDVSPEVFTTFVDSVFHNGIAQDGDDLTEWAWEYLFRCYIFGDKYDSKGFRDRVFEAIQTKMLVRKPKGYDFPKGKHFGIV